MKIDGLMITKAKFSKMVESEVIMRKLSYMDSIVYLCEKNRIEIDDVKKFLSRSIKDKLEQEARNLNYLPKKNQLPLD